MIPSFEIILIFILALIFSGVFSGFETAFYSCNHIRVRHLAQQAGKTSARRLQHYLDRPERMITAVLIGNNIALLTATIPLTRELGAVWAMILVTPAVLLFGEIIPKSISRTHPTRISLALISLMHCCYRLLLPVAAPLAWISKKFLAARVDDERSIRGIMRSPEDMRVLVDESADRGTIEHEEKEMIHSVMDLQRRFVKEIMIPRVDIHALPDTASRKELIAHFMESGYTRIPIYKDTIDNIIGVVNAFDILKDTAPEKDDIQRFIKDVLYVHDTMKLDDVLKAMRDAKQSMAIVTDEYGGTDGLVTIEDILEEIFGEIHDEYDDEEPLVRKVGEQDFVIQARTPLDTVFDQTGIKIEDEEVETFGGWIMHAMGRIPQKGEVIVLTPYRLTILDGGPSYLSLIRLEILAHSEQAAPTSTEQDSQ